MCGIVGAIRLEGDLVQGLIEGLRTLEYRGYDSSGVAFVADGRLVVRKRQGRLENLEELLRADGPDGAGAARAHAGIGHTRWATHGPPSDRNAHPHQSAGQKVVVVHNGIFENYLELRAEQTARGIVLQSDTDTEVLAHMVEAELATSGNLAEAVRLCLGRIEGYYAVAVLAQTPEGTALVCARHGPPLAVGWNAEGAWLASDVLGILPYTTSVVYLEDGDVASLRPGRVEITDLAGRSVHRPARIETWDPQDAGKGHYPHYMLKEIHEQPDVLARTAFERIDEEGADVVFEDGQLDDDFVRGIRRVQITACGTALHAGYMARYLIEGLAGIPVDVDYASEFRYRDPRLVPGTLCLAISQSGETADTLAASRLSRELGASVLAICNVAGSTQVRESDQVVLTHAGPEIGVASTKAFTAQVVAAFLVALRMGRARGFLGEDPARVLLSELRLLRPKLEGMLSDKNQAIVREHARKQVEAKGFLFLGRGVNYPVALEGALKLKEISYMHAEGYPAGEMKHGPIALIDPGMTIVAINSKGRVAEKVRSNIEQVKARGGVVVSVGNDPQSHQISGASIHVPDCSEWLSPILNTVPLQLLAYHIADLRGCDIDKPRNLAKSVTVE
jgi:glucosamine--fructose-6-phosphate aminotransferase (isomerizing)